MDTIAITDGFIRELQRMSSTNAVAPPLLLYKHTLQEALDHVRLQRTYGYETHCRGGFFENSLLKKFFMTDEEFLLLPYSHSVSASSQLTGYFFRVKGSVNLLAYI